MKDKKFIIVTGACMFLLLMMIGFNVGGPKKTYSATSLKNGCETTNSSYVRVSGTSVCCPSGTTPNDGKTLCCPSGYVENQGYCCPSSYPYYSAAGSWGYVAGYCYSKPAGNYTFNNDTKLCSNLLGVSAGACQYSTKPNAAASTVPYNSGNDEEDDAQKIPNTDGNNNNGYVDGADGSTATRQGNCNSTGGTWVGGTTECECKPTNTRIWDKDNAKCVDKNSTSEENSGEDDRVDGDGTTKRGCTNGTADTSSKNLGCTKCNTGYNLSSITENGETYYICEKEVTKRTCTNGTADTSEANLGCTKCNDGYSLESKTEGGNTYFVCTKSSSTEPEKFAGKLGNTNKLKNIAVGETGGLIVSANADASYTAKISGTSGIATISDGASGTITDRTIKYVHIKGVKAGTTKVQVDFIVGGKVVQTEYADVVVAEGGEGYSCWSCTYTNGTATRKWAKDTLNLGNCVNGWQKLTSSSGASVAYSSCTDIQGKCYRCNHSGAYKWSVTSLSTSSGDATCPSGWAFIKNTNEESECKSGASSSSSSNNGGGSDYSGNDDDSTSDNNNNNNNNNNNTGNNNNTNNNPQTGNIMIFMVWIIGFGVVGYSFWYFKELRGNG